MRKSKKGNQDVLAEKAAASAAQKKLQKTLDESKAQQKELDTVCRAVARKGAGKL